AVAADGRVFVCDRESDRIQIFSPDGEYLSEWGDTQRPTHIVFDEQGRAYVSELWWHKGQTSRRHGVTQEPKHGRVSVFDKDGRLLARWGTPEPTSPARRRRRRRSASMTGTGARPDRSISTCGGSIRSPSRRRSRTRRRSWRATAGTRCSCAPTVRRCASGARSRSI